MQLTIKNKIYGSFLLLAIIFVINGVFIVTTLNYSTNLQTHFSEVSNPSIHYLYDFRKMMLQSQMYTTNWVFLRADEEDKNALIEIHKSSYPLLKGKLSALVEKWYETDLKDSLPKLFGSIEENQKQETSIMLLLTNFEDYDDPEKKFGAAFILENEILPDTKISFELLEKIVSYEKAFIKQEENKIAKATNLIRILIFSLSLLIIISVIIFSRYMAKTIINPINKIISIVNDLGKGKINKIDLNTTNDELGNMMRAVNNLSFKIGLTANFANEIGNRNFESIYEPLSEYDKLGMALIAMRDNLKKSDEELRTNNAELKKTNTELDKFVYSISHDLRAPLSSILGVLNITEMKSKEELTLKHLGMIKKSINKLDAFISDIMDYSRNERLNVQYDEIDFKELLSEINDNLKNLSITREVKLDVRIDSCPKFKSDKRRLAVILNNIISNAMRYQNPNTDSPFVRVDITSDEQEVKIAVRDNGIGIGAAYKEKVFDMFYRVSDASVGSGLGLYIVKETLAKLNGGIELESEPGKGSVFTLHIPNYKMAS